MKTLLHILFITLIASPTLANEMTLAEAEVTLADLMKNMRASDNDQERNALNEEFSTLLRRTLKIKGAYDYPFAQLQMFKEESPDGAFRMFNWNVANNDFTHQFYCLIMRYNKKYKDYEIFELRDKHKELRDPEKKILYQTHWMGCLYYDIIPMKKNGRKIYTLLGWQGNDRLTQRKIIEVLTFEGKGRVKLGAPIFKSERGKTMKRVVFEYSADVMMTVRYHPKEQIIIFDHLSSQVGFNPDNTATQGPDLSYDGFQLKGSRWVYVRELNPNLERNRRRDREYTQPVENPNPAGG